MSYGWLDFIGFESFGWILCNVMTWRSGFKAFASHRVWRNVIAGKWYLTKMDPNGRRSFLAHLTQSWCSFFNPKLPLCKGIYSWQDCRVTDTLTHCWWECKLVQHWWSQVGSIFLSCKHTHFLIQILNLLRIYPKAILARVWNGTHKKLSNAVLFAKAKDWKQHIYLSLGGW